MKTLRISILATTALVIGSANAGGLLGGGVTGALGGSGMADGAGRGSFDTMRLGDGTRSRMNRTNERASDATGALADRGKSAASRAKSAANDSEVVLDGGGNGGTKADREGIASTLSPQASAIAGRKTPPAEAAPCEPK